MISKVAFKDTTDLSGNVLKAFTGDAVRVSARVWPDNAAADRLFKPNVLFLF